MARPMASFCHWPPEKLDATQGRADGGGAPVGEAFEDVEGSGTAQGAVDSGLVVDVGDVAATDAFSGDELEVDEALEAAG